MVARTGAGQPSHRASTSWPMRSVASLLSGTKKRSRRLESGSRLATGLPAGTHSPGR